MLHSKSQPLQVQCSSDQRLSARMMNVLRHSCCVQVCASLSEAKYACGISDEVAEKIARNVKVSLRDYLLYV